MHVIRFDVLRLAAFVQHPEGFCRFFISKYPGVAYLTGPDIHKVMVEEAEKMAI